MKNTLLNSWYSKVKKLILKNKDGFFLIPILSNSPESTVKSLSKMPFVYHDKQKHVFGSKNPMLNANINYHKIEEGLWFMYAFAQYKENLHYIRELHKDIESEYFLLFIELNKSVAKSKNGLIDGLTYENSSWVLVKPTGNSDHCRFKGNETISLAIYFTKDWLKVNLLQNQSINTNQIESFLKSNSGIIILPEDNEMSINFKLQIEQIFKEKIEKGRIEANEWKFLAMNFIQRFLSRISEENISNNIYEIGHVDRLIILKVEKILIDNLQSKFMGIETLAEKVGASPTKLKSNFKLIHGDTIFQFFRKKQLESAKTLLESQSISVQKLAEIFGYSNSSKFTAAYKMHFGVSPSAHKLKGN